MKEQPRFLIDYKTFTSTIDEVKATAESLNGSHANDVFLAAIEEFQGKLMKRKEAKAKVKEYLAEKEVEMEQALKKQLGGAKLESHPLFETVTAAKWGEMVAKAQERMEKLDEMNDGDEAKVLLFFITRNMSVLNCYVGREGCEKLMDAVATCLKAAVGRREREE